MSNLVFHLPRTKTGESHDCPSIFHTYLLIALPVLMTPEHLKRIPRKLFRTARSLNGSADQGGLVGLKIENLVWALLDRKAVSTIRDSYSRQPALLTFRKSIPKVNSTMNSNGVY